MSTKEAKRGEALSKDAGMILAPGTLKRRVDYAKVVEQKKVSMGLKGEVGARGGGFRKLFQSTFRLPSFVWADPGSEYFSFDVPNPCGPKITHTPAETHIKSTLKLANGRGPRSANSTPPPLRIYQMKTTI
ncbi:hypothetical protein BD779DRAFT_1474966 [Infundibulicybe gibba]|nr:hypothetical protein BD779DRAFT_1474966 [Infundibulicybe gibba]